MVVSKECAAIFAPMRPAFSVVELLVAIVVLTIGVLALAATAGLVAGHVGDGGRLTGAAYAARTVLDSLATKPCTLVTSGASSRGGVSLSWTVARDSASATVAVVVGSALRRGTARDAYHTLIPCVRQ